MVRERDVSEQERLDRIGRHIKQLAEASAALQVELRTARQLAAKRARDIKPHPSDSPRPKSRQKNR